LQDIQPLGAFIPFNTSS